MPSGIQVGDMVFLPATRVGDQSGVSAVRQYRVVERNTRSLKVERPGGAYSRWIGTSAAHRLLGIYIVRIGDFATEDVLLDPLLKSVLQFTRLLLPDEYVRAIEVRSSDELQHFWSRDSGAYSHVILIGHGGPNGLQFGSQWVPAKDVAETFAADAIRRTFVSLCCATGKASFGRAFSASPCCGSLVAPFHSVHGAVASQFCQSFLTHHLLEGVTTAVAYNRAHPSTPGGTIFRLWRNGAMG